MSRFFFHPIAGILIWFFVFFLGYGAFISIFSPKVDIAPQEQRAKNRIRAERFIYKNKNYQAVIVGSSMTARLPSNELGRNIYKLCFGGGTAIEGLEIILKSKKVPKIVFIETNALAKQPGMALLDHLFFPGLNGLRHCFPALWTEYRPTSFLVSAFSGLSDIKRKIPVKKSASSQILQRNVKRAIEDENRYPDESVLSENLERLEHLVTEIQEEGAEIVFLEMPMHPEVRGTLFRRTITDRVHKRFPPEQYLWLKPADQRNFVTTDGVHLREEEAKSVARQISDLATEVFLTASYENFGGRIQEHYGTGTLPGTLFEAGNN